jgi:hypothetical protein
MHFSGALVGPFELRPLPLTQFRALQTLTDLNDFITPSQACIKPVESSKPSPEWKELGAASVSIPHDAECDLLLIQRFLF